MDKRSQDSRHTPTIDAHFVAAVTRDQMREVDRLMIEEYGISLLQMMENAGRALAELARFTMGGAISGQRVVVLAGPGGNGGGGLVAARRLHNWGAAVSVLLSHPAMEMAEVPQHQLRAVGKIGAAISVWNPSTDSANSMRNADLIIDALVGYSLHGNLREPAAAMVRAANEASTPVLALDVPSGMDPDSGDARDPTMRAASTLTLALPKRGLIEPRARPYVGRLYIADISVPAGAYRRIGIEVEDIFARGDIVAVSDEEGTIGG